MGQPSRSNAFGNSVSLLIDRLDRFPIYLSPHPFISLLTPVKGKKILPRISRHLSVERMQILTTLLVACFGQLDVVLSAPLLDSLRDSPRLHDVERQTQAFLGSVLQSVLPQIAKASLRFVSGMLGLLLDRCDILVAVKSKVNFSHISTRFLTLNSAWFGNPDFISEPYRSHQTKYYYYCNSFATSYSRRGSPMVSLTPMNFVCN